MRTSKKITALILAAAMAAALSACGGSSSSSKAPAAGETSAAETSAAETPAAEAPAAETSAAETSAAGETSAAAETPAASAKDAKLSIATQYGLSYAPYAIMKANDLIEKYYDGNLEIEWTTLNSGSAINEAFASGQLDVGAMGIGPAITGITSGVNYKIYSNISSIPNKLYTNDPSTKSLADIGDKKIALVNVGSAQHLFLAMGAEKELGDAHALDQNIVAMAHPDGMTSLLSGSVDLHLTSAPYTFLEDDDPNISLVYDFSAVWPEGNSFILGLASDKLYSENPDLYQAVLKATEEAMTFLKEQPAEAAKILATDGSNDAATYEDWLTRPGVTYSTETGGILEMAAFMDKYDFITNEASSDYSTYVFDNVKGN